MSLRKQHKVDNDEKHLENGTNICGSVYRTG